MTIVFADSSENGERKMEKISGKKPIYKNKWVLLGGIIGFFVILFGSLCWCCCGGFLTGSDARERVRRDVGEGKSTVTAPYRATQLDNAEVDMPEADAVLTVPEEATSRLADKLEKGWVRCVLPPDLPPLRASLVDGPGRHIRDGVLTAMVDEPDGSYGLRPEPISPFETIHDAIRHMEALRAGEYAEFVQEDLDEVLQLNNEPVAIIRWWGAEPGQQGTCTVTDEVVLVDVPVRVVWNDGTPASNVTVTASDHQSPDGKTDAEGRTMLQSLLGAKIVISASEQNYGFRVDKTQLVKKGEACELVLDSLPPEQWAPQVVQARVQRSLDRGTNYNAYLRWPGRTMSAHSRAAPNQAGVAVRDSSSPGFAACPSYGALRTHLAAFRRGEGLFREASECHQREEAAAVFLSSAKSWRVKTDLGDRRLWPETSRHAAEKIIVNRWSTYAQAAKSHLDAGLEVKARDMLLTAASQDEEMALSLRTAADELPTPPGCFLPERWALDGGR